MATERSWPEAAIPALSGTSDGTGHLVYVNKATLFAIPFDLDKLETRGTAVPVLDDVAYVSQSDAGHFDVSRAGTLIYRRASGAPSAMTTLQWVDRRRQEGAAAGDARRLSGPTTVAGRQADRADGLGGSESGHLGLRPAAGRHDAADLRRSVYRYPVWSPDGQYIVFDTSAAASSRRARMAPASRKH